MSTPFPVVTEFRVEGEKETLSAIQELVQAYRDSALGVKEFREHLRTTTEAYYTHNKAMSAMRTVVRVHNAELIEFTKVFYRVGSIGRELVSMWTAYNVAQIRVERTERDLLDAKDKLTFWQMEYNRLLKDFGGESVYAIEAYKRMKDAEKDVEEASRKLSQVQQENIVGFASLGLEALGLIGSFSALYVQIQTLRGVQGLGGLSGALSGLSGAFAGMGASAVAAFGVGGAAILGFYAAMATNLVGIRDAWREHWDITLILSMQRFEWFVGSVIAWFPEISKVANDVCTAIETAWGGMINRLIDAWIPFANLFPEPSKTHLPPWYGGGTVPWNPPEAPPTPPPAPTTPTYTVPEAYARTVLGTPYLQTGLPYVPETMHAVLHKGEAVLPEPEARTYRRERVGVRSVEIRNYFGDVRGEIDLDRAGERVYQKFMERLGDRW